PGLPKRTLRFPVTMASDLFTDLSSRVSTVRVVFSDYMEHRWVVLADPAKAVATGFTLPHPPGTIVDRTFADGMTAGTRSALLVQTIRLNANPTDTANLS